MLALLLLCASDWIHIAGKEKKDATLEVLGAPCEKTAVLLPVGRKAAVISTEVLWGWNYGESITLGGTNWASQVPVVKSPPANAGGARDERSLPGSGKSLQEGMAIHCSVLAGSWTQEPGGLWSIGLHRGRRA